ncbi:MBL fold metallo-hydrolase [Oceanobacillus sp. CFH 90083]|uniref:MBL fold metallo-hydrolase n=1 Tax=Oceanobacillus sp. CFH 90083 TaxID=2592336 RepID=UPI00128E63A9|nr:MBL fold metallo-hydrolase [Oceanobacillus sp. CFH 90083]
MLEQITDDIYRLVVRYKGAMGEVNSYFIKGNHGYTVIDTGIDAPETRALWERAFRNYKIEKLVLTHTHEDHIGLARWFQEIYEIPVYVSRRGYKEMCKGRDAKARKKRLKSLIKKHGAPPIPLKIKDESHIYKFEPDGFFDDNDEITLGNRSYQTIWTPGHAPDHYCFYQLETEVMIIGDHVLNHLSPVIGLWMGEEHNPMEAYFGALELLKEYQVRLALPGHGDPVEYLDERITDILYRHEKRMEQLLELMETGEMTAFKLTTKAYGPMKSIAFASQFMATLTRLIYLEEQSKIKVQVKKGKKYYGLPAKDLQAIRS